MYTTQIYSGMHWLRKLRWIGKISTNRPQTVISQFYKRHLRLFSAILHCITKLILCVIEISSVAWLGLSSFLYKCDSFSYSVIRHHAFRLLFTVFQLNNSDRQSTDVTGNSCWGLLGRNMRDTMGLLPDTQNCGLRMRREYRERFPRHRLQMKPLVSDPGMHHGTCVTQVPWCMSGSLTSGGGENVPSIPGACATRNFTYQARGPREYQSPNVSNHDTCLWQSSAWGW